MKSSVWMLQHSTKCLTNTLYSLNDKLHIERKEERKKYEEKKNERESMRWTPNTEYGTRPAEHTKFQDTLWATFSNDMNCCICERVNVCIRERDGEGEKESVSVYFYYCSMEHVWYMIHITHIQEFSYSSTPFDKFYREWMI